MDKYKEYFKMLSSGKVFCTGDTATTFNIENMKVAKDLVLNANKWDKEQWSKFLCKYSDVKVDATAEFIKYAFEHYQIPDDAINDFLDIGPIANNKLYCSIMKQENLSDETLERVIGIMSSFSSIDSSHTIRTRFISGMSETNRNRIMQIICKNNMEINLVRSIVAYPFMYCDNIDFIKELVDNYDINQIAMSYILNNKNIDENYRNQLFDVFGINTNIIYNITPHMATSLCEAAYDTYDVKKNSFAAISHKRDAARVLKNIFKFLPKNKQDEMVFLVTHHKKFLGAESDILTFLLRQHDDIKLEKYIYENLQSIAHKREFINTGRASDEILKIFLSESLKSVIKKEKANKKTPETVLIDCTTAIARMSQIDKETVNMLMDAKNQIGNNSIDYMIYFLANNRYMDNDTAEYLKEIFNGLEDMRKYSNSHYTFHKLGDDYKYEDFLLDVHKEINKLNLDKDTASRLFKVFDSRCFYGHEDCRFRFAPHSFFKHIEDITLRMVDFYEEKGLKNIAHGILNEFRQLELDAPYTALFGIGEKEIEEMLNGKEVEEISLPYLHCVKLQLVDKIKYGTVDASRGDDYEKNSVDLLFETDKYVDLYNTILQKIDKLQEREVNASYDER